MVTKEVVYKDVEYDLIITVGKADVRMGIRRAVLGDAQSIALGPVPKDRDLTREELELRFLRLATYPMCLAGTVKVQAAPGTKPFDPTNMTVDQFLALPEELVAAWGNEVALLNKHWWPTPEDTSKEKTKDLGEASSSASSTLPEVPKVVTPPSLKKD